MKKLPYPLPFFFHPQSIARKHNAKVQNKREGVRCWGIQDAIVSGIAGGLHRSSHIHVSSFPEI